MNHLRHLAGRVLNAVGLAHIRITDDSGPQQLSQVEYGAGGPAELGEIIDQTPRIAHYGIAYCPPDGSECVVVYLGGRRSSGVIIATGHRETRPKDLQPGEAMLYNGLTDTWIRMCADGVIRSKGPWEHDGAFSATGDILDRSAVNAATMKIHRDAYNAHHHGGVTAGGAMTGVTDTAAP